jgi:hypothetical protein
MAQSVFPTPSSGATAPQLRHTVNSSQTIATNNAGGFQGYALVISGGGGGGGTSGAGAGGAGASGVVYIYY